MIDMYFMEMSGYKIKSGIDFIIVESFCGD